MFSVNKRSHVIRHVLTLRIFGTSKKLRFRRNREEVLNWLNSVGWGELHKGYVQEPQGEITCRGHVQGSDAGDMRVAQSDLHLWMGGVITVQTLWVKRMCQLVVRVKANKCYQRLLRYLSSYINLLNIRLFGRLQAPGRFQTFCPWSRTHTGSRPLAMLAFVLVFDQLFFGKIGCNPTALR